MTWKYDDNRNSKLVMVGSSPVRQTHGLKIIGHKFSLFSYQV